MNPFLKVFDEFAARAKRANLDGRDVLIGSIDDLIAMKEKSNRPVDQADIEALRKIRSIGPCPTVMVL